MAVIDSTKPSRRGACRSRPRYKDDQQTPDTTVATFDCGDRMIIWEAVAWATPLKNIPAVGIEFRGDKGSIYCDDASYTLYDADGKEIETKQAGRGDEEHLDNFFAGVRDGAAPNANIENGHKSVMFCHLGNMAFRTGQTLDIDTTTGRVKNSEAAMQHWGREYRQGWSPEEIS